MEACLRQHIPASAKQQFLLLSLVSLYLVVGRALAYRAGEDIKERMSEVRTGGSAVLGLCSTGSVGQHALCKMHKKRCS